MYSSHEGEIDIPNLPPAARTVHIVPDLKSHSLLSIGQLCDAGCVVEFTATTVIIQHNDIVVLQGHRTPETQLWHIEIPKAPIAQTNAAVGSATAAELVSFAHASLFSPAISTLATALSKGYIPNFPGLSSRTLRNHPPRSSAMIKGHLDQSRKNQRSTNTSLITPDPDAQSEPDPDDFPTSPPSGERSHFCYVSIMEPTGQIYTDQTGKFVTPSSNGNNYLLVLYDYDSNAILAEPMKSRHGPAILSAYKLLHAKLCAAGLRPQLQRLDNECSDSLKAYMSAQDIDFQLVPPGVHRRNAAERAIRTFKNHFIAGLCSVDKDFPLHLWDRLLPQALLSLNLLRGSRLNPKLSAWAQMFGNFDFNRTPIAPPGVRVIVHEKPSKRSTWAPHGTDGWYIGPALESYRCYTVWIWDTRSIRLCDTLSWFPTKVTMPIASSNDLILAGIQDILEALRNPTLGSPIDPLTDSHVATLKILSELLTGLIPVPKPLLDPEPAPTPPLRVATPQSPQLLRVDPIPSPGPHLVADDTPTPSPIPPLPITPPPTPLIVDASSSPPVTYENSTGSKRRRRRQKAPKPQATAAHLEVDPPHWALHGNAFNPDTGKIAQYPELSRCSEGPLWQRGNSQEIGRLAQGLGELDPTIKGTNTMFFIDHKAVPKGRKITYLNVISAYRPEKKDPHRVRWTCGGDQVGYPGNVSTKTADITTAKILINSVLSTPKSKMVLTDLKDFYLGTPMERYEYMRIPVHMIPDNIMELYKLHDLVHNGYVIVEIRKGMYGLPQAGKLANDRLQKFLEPHGYCPTNVTAGLWKHKTRPIAFALVVDDFAIKYTNKDDADHLLTTLEKLYVCSTDWDAKRYCGLNLDWDYKARTCKISMPGYVERALQRFQHAAPSQPEHSPHAWQKPIYGAKTQYAPPDDISTPLDAADTKRVQEILGTFLYYARAVDSSMLVALGTLATQQSKGTRATMIALTQLLNYAATHPDASILFVASDMCLHVSSDASYLSVPKARSRASGYHYLSNRPLDPSTPPLPTDPDPPANGAIHIYCQILKEVLSSASESELAALFHNGKEACPLRICLEELGHPQPPTPIQTDNSTAAGIANESVKQKRSKAIDMRFYWIRDRVRQGQFLVYWKKGILKKADYFTKHHPTSHHRAIRSSYFHSPNDCSRNYFECLQDADDVEATPVSNSITFADPIAT